MMTIAFVAALLAGQTPAAQTPSQTVILSQQNKAVIRCSAAFALVSARQSAGDAAAGKWPLLDRRGREFFVVALAGIMDERSLDRPAITKLVRAEAERLNATKEVDAVMPACLLMLETSGV